MTTEACAPLDAEGLAAERLQRLTPREREVLDLALKGHSSKVVAPELGISHRTVELHRSHLLEKLGVTSVSELTGSSNPGRIVPDRRCALVGLSRAVCARIAFNA